MGPGRGAGGTEIEVDSLPAYLACVLQIRRNDVAWFRGVCHADYGLVPGLHRLDAPAEETSWLTNVEDSMCREFLVHAPSKGLGIPESRWHLYSLMQHHGLPTRLLDWSRSPLVALHFALMGSRPEQDAAVWVLLPKALNREVLGVERVFTPDGVADSYLPSSLRESDKKGMMASGPMALEPRLTHPRIIAQQGTFTVHGTSPAALEDQREAAASLRKIVLPGERLVEMTSDLQGLGFVEDSIQPDLDALCRRIRRTHLPTGPSFPAA